MTLFRSLLAASLLAIALPALAEDAPRKSTANANVHVLAPIRIAGLDRDRTVRIYLPPGYATSGKRYRVLYLYDGQNLFDDATSYVGEWGVDESLDALAAEGLEFIAVGIDHGAEKRVHELNPWNPLDPKYAPPEGITFLEFVVRQVKPFVEANYRTLPGRENTAIGGSSLGGQMAHYALEKYPALFGRALVFSPAYWIGGEAAYDYTTGRGLPPGVRYYATTGSKEGDEAVAALHRMAGILRANGHADFALYSEVREGAEHNETYWKAEFPQAVRWLFPDAPAE